ncbi:hypothetical protein MCOR07_008613 [Pyricularia oryzae]|nr:hypothetical protein MCOR01_002186 [Pyricularia oryzae]KAI6614550.1 hypothetical protein MCOR07_008613 [Pyricularia oryzae]
MHSWISFIRFFFFGSFMFLATVWKLASLLIPYVHFLGFGVGLAHIQEIFNLLLVLGTLIFVWFRLFEKIITPRHRTNLPFAYLQLGPQTPSLKVHALLLL